MKKIKFAMQKGFTLIELLIVIAILGVLAAGVLVAIDPVDRINSANDSRVQNDIGTTGRAAEAYAATHNGFYPAVIADLVTSGDLKTAPVAPTGYAYTYTASPPSCTTGLTCTSFTLTSPLKSKKYTAATPAKPFQKYESLTGKSCQVTFVGDACQ